MAELVVVAFGDPCDPVNALRAVQRLQRDYLVDPEDIVVAMRGGDGAIRLARSGTLRERDAAFESLWADDMLSSMVNMVMLHALAGFCSAAWPMLDSTSSAQA